MGVVLVTGASGYLGSRLVEQLSASRPVIGMSRKPVSVPGRETVRGDCGSFEDLRQLDGRQIDAVVHLAGETGGSTEEAALAANMQGSRRLLRYLSDRGCRKFVLASSIAAAGALDRAFVPAQLPVPADHPCLARDAYGLSKALLEQLAGYFSRVVADGEFTSLRFGWVTHSVRPEMPWCDAAQPPGLPFLFLAQVATPDVLDGITAVLDAPTRPGARVYNLVAPDLRVKGRVADFLRACLGARSSGLDLEAFELPGKDSPPVYSMAGWQQDFGFCPRHGIGMA